MATPMMNLTEEERKRRERERVLANQGRPGASGYQPSGNMSLGQLGLKLTGFMLKPEVRDQIQARTDAAAAAAAAERAKPTPLQSPPSDNNQPNSLPRSAGNAPQPSAAPARPASPGATLDQYGDTYAAGGLAALPRNASGTLELGDPSSPFTVQNEGDVQVVRGPSAYTPPSQSGAMNQMSLPPLRFNKVFDRRGNQVDTVLDPTSVSARGDVIAANATRAESADRGGGATRSTSDAISPLDRAKFGLDVLDTQLKMDEASRKRQATNFEQIKGAAEGLAPLLPPSLQPMAESFTTAVANQNRSPYEAGVIVQNMLSRISQSDGPIYADSQDPTVRSVTFKNLFEPSKGPAADQLDALKMQTIMKLFDDTLSQY